MTRERMLTVRTIAGRLDVSETTVRRMCTSGEIRAAKVGGTWKIRERDFREYYERAFGLGGPYDPEVSYRR